VPKFYLAKSSGGAGGVIGGGQLELLLLPFERIVVGRI